MTRLTSPLTTALYRPTAGSLTGASVYALAAGALLLFVDGLPAAVRIPLALPLLLVVPGYAAVTVLVPKPRPPRDADGTEPEVRPEPGLSAGERLVLSVVASIALVPAAVLATLPVTGVGRTPTLVAVVALTLALAAVAILRLPVRTRPEARREAVPAIDRLSVPTDAVSLVAIGLVAVLLLSSAGLALTSGSDALRTEFYVADQPADDAAGTYDLRVDHHGGSAQTYTLAVAVTDGSGDEVTWRALQRRTVTVGPDETGAASVTLSDADFEDATGIRLALYTGEPGDLADVTPHRTLELSVGESADSGE